MTESSQENSKEQIRKRTREGWSRAAVGWDRYWPVIERATAPVSQRLLEVAEIRPGDRVLDLATGIGEPAVSAASAAGKNGFVVGIDLSPRMLHHARARAERRQLQNLAFLEGDMEEVAGRWPDQPPWTTSRNGEGSALGRPFNVVLSRFGIMFVQDLPGAFQKLARLHRPGGRLALVVWDLPEQVPLIQIPTVCLQRIFGLEPPPEDAPGPFRCSGPRALHQLEDALTRAGYGALRTDRVLATLELDSPEAFARYSVATSTRTQQTLVEQPDLRETYMNALISEAEAYATPGGKVRLQNHAIVLWTRRSVASTPAPPSA